MNFNETIQFVINELKKEFNTNSNRPCITINVKIKDRFVLTASIVKVPCKDFTDWEFKAMLRDENGDIERGLPYPVSLGSHCETSYVESDLKDMLHWYFDHGNIVSKERVHGFDERYFEYWETRIKYEDGFVDYVDEEREYY